MLFGHKMKTYAFVGPSGTGKSYRAQMVANERGINYIIDDGLLISGNEVLAGISAKKAPTKIETVRNALFQNEERKKEIQKRLNGMLCHFLHWLVLLLPLTGGCGKSRSAKSLWGIACSNNPVVILP